MIAATRLGAVQPYVYLSTTRTSSGDLDLIAIERAVNGDGPVTLTWAEQIDAARRLDALGVGATEAAHRIGVSRDLLRDWKTCGYRPTPPREAPKCGTPRGYRSHLAHSQNPCEPCRTAQRAHRRTARTRMETAA